MTEGPEYLSHAHARVWDAKLETLQTLRHSTVSSGTHTKRSMTEGLEGLQVNRHTRAREGAQTLRHPPSVAGAT